MSIKPLYLMLAILVSMYLTGCIYYGIVYQDISTEELPNLVSQTFLEVSQTSLSNIYRVQTRIFREKIIQYLITYQPPDKQMFIMGISPEGQMVFNMSLQEWENQ